MLEPEEYKIEMDLLLNFLLLEINSRCRVWQFREKLLSQFPCASFKGKEPSQQHSSASRSCGKAERDSGQGME